MPLPPDFDPDGPGGGDGLYGLPLAPSECAVSVIPVPWEATASSGRGTSAAPAAILEASHQVDLADLDYGDFWRQGVGFARPDPRIARWAHEAEADAQAVLAAGGGLPEAAARVDALGDRVHASVYERAVEVLDRGGVPAVLGGDHSAPYGLIRAVAERHPGVGVLHIDAHADLRVAYLGFRWSHASIFHNVLELPEVARLVGVGWRDVGAAEIARVRTDPDRIRAFWDRDLGAGAADGEPWSRVVARIIEALPPTVHVSVDIDGLSPALCGATGTPVPGGLSFRELQVLLRHLSAERAVVGFDLCEVGAADWDANVGARVLYKLAGCALRSKGRA